MNLQFRALFQSRYWLSARSFYKKWRNSARTRTERQYRSGSSIRTLGKIWRFLSKFKFIHLLQRLRHSVLFSCLPESCEPRQRRHFGGAASKELLQLAWDHIQSTYSNHEWERRRQDWPRRVADLLSETYIEQHLVKNVLCLSDFWYIELTDLATWLRKTYTEAFAFVCWRLKIRPKFWR